MIQPARIHRAVLVLTFAVLALVSAFVWVRLTGLSDGARMDSVTEPESLRTEGVVVAVWDDEPGGLQDGDVVMAVDGRDIEAMTRSLASPGQWRPLGSAGETLTYTLLRDGQQLDVPVRLRPYPLRIFLARDWSPILSFVVFLVVAAVVYAKRPDEPAALALLLCALGGFANVTYFFGLQIGDLSNGIGFWLSTFTEAGYTLFSIALLHFWLVFPRPHPLVTRRPWFLPALYVVPYALILVISLALWLSARSTLDWISRSEVVGGLTSICLIASALVAAIVALRSARDAVSRRQVRWVAFAVLITIAGVAVWTLFQALAVSPPSWLLPLLFGLPIPLAVAVAILRHHLFDIDVILSRTLLWFTLTAFVIGMYVLVVGLLGTLVNARGDLALSLVATGLVALLFQPLRHRIQRIVNRFVYGDREDPYAVVSRLGQRLEATLVPEAILPTIVETVAQALKLPYAAISLRQGDALEVAAVYGTPGRDLVNLPLTYQSEPVGQLSLAPRVPGDAFTPADRRLLQDLARQVGVVAHAVRLASDVQRSRERLVTAREEERRRLRRDLHDGLGPSLAGITLKLEAARNLLPRDPAAVDTLLADLKTQAQAAIADVRRAVYDLRPPALDELGLVSALCEHAARIEVPGLHITVAAPDELPSLPAAVEVAAYRIVLEALTNIVRHAGARTCAVRLSLADALVIEIVDDGRGLPPDLRAGVGLTAMRERTAELGGALTIDSPSERGTRIEARLPLPHHAEG